MLAAGASTGCMAIFHLLIIPVSGRRLITVSKGREKDQLKAVRGFDYTDFIP